MSGAAIFPTMRSSASSVSPAPIFRAVSMNRSNCGFSSGGGGLRAGMASSPVSFRVSMDERYGSISNADKRIGLAIVVHPGPNSIGVRFSQRINAIRKTHIPYAREESQHPLLMEGCHSVAARGRPCSAGGNANAEAGGFCVDDLRRYRKESRNDRY